MSKKSILKKINFDINDYKKLSEINLLELFLKESIILETVKENIPHLPEDKKLLIDNWFKKFNQQITNELIDFPIKEIKNEENFFNILIRKSLWIDWCKENFSNDISIEFNEKKSSYDLITYQLLRTKNKNLSNELYFKITEDNESFEDLSLQYSEGSERFSKGIIGPVRANLPHPKLLDCLKNSTIDKVNSPIEIDGWWIICKLKKLEHAMLDDLLSTKISLELGNKYINSITRDFIKDLLNNF